MNVEATTLSPLATEADTIAVGVFEGEGVPHDLPGELLTALLHSGEAKTKLGSLAGTHAEGRRILLVGLGERDRFDAEDARVAAAAVHGRALELSSGSLCWEVPHHVSDDVVAGLVEGSLLHGYRFARYKPQSDRHEVSGLIISAHHDVAQPVSAATVIADAQNRARDLGNTPANDLSPAALADYAQELGARHGVGVTVLDEQTITSLGMGAFTAVARGSDQEARLIRMEYQGAQTRKVGLIGKAVTFDSGGLSLKGGETMSEMKFDMCGGAAVIEAIAALAQLNVPVNILGVVGATENLPSGSAVKPGDVVRALDGTTIEVNNTDAEGRLVLADCLCYARQEGCERLVDIATLTGGMKVALGSVYAGMTANDNHWAAHVIDSGQRTGELVWRMPLHRRYAEMVEGRYAQLTNLSERREASPITAAEFLHHFAGEVPWAHLDIAGTAWNVPRPYFDKGATGFGVRLLVELARSLDADDGSPAAP
ncbi:MAG TPA: leucyl aminopeptidase [Solirubrobacteraceae bacterium]